MSVTRWGLLPDVIGVGPARTGTTWLHEKLSGRVDLPRGLKETKFFERYHARGIEWYASLFRHSKGDRPIAEICPYLAGPHAPEWIAEVIPNCKLIVTLRDPVDRMYSHYKMMRGYAFTRLPVEEALRADRFLAQGSLYASNLERWFAIFPRSNFLITLYEDLRQRPQAYLDCITDFIGIKRISLARKKERRYLINSFDRAPRSFKLAQNARHLRIRLREKDWNRTANLLARMGVWGWCAGGGPKFPPLSPEQDERFRELYLPEIEALEKLVGCDLSTWKRRRLPSADQVATSVSPRAFAQTESPTSLHEFRSKAS
jgi:Sulfotransferase domain